MTNNRRNLTVRWSDAELAMIDEWAEKYGLPRSIIIRAPWALAVKDRRYRRWFEYFFRYMRPGTEDAKYQDWKDYIENGGQQE